jgi:hypothetical protein
MGIFKNTKKSKKYSDLLLSITVLMFCSQTEAWAGTIWHFIRMQTTGIINWRSSAYKQEQRLRRGGGNLPHTRPSVLGGDLGLY